MQRLSGDRHTSSRPEGASDTGSHDFDHGFRDRVQWLRSQDAAARWLRSPRRTPVPSGHFRAREETAIRNGLDLTGSELFIRGDTRAPRVAIVKRPRIGVDDAGHWARRLLPFYEKGNPYISRV